MKRQISHRYDRSRRAGDGMGVSSERVGYAGPEHPEATNGTRVTSPPPLPEDTPPEQEPGSPEGNPIGIPPKPPHSKNPGHSHS